MFSNISLLDEAANEEMDEIQQLLEDIDIGNNYAEFDNEHSLPASTLASKKKAFIAEDKSFFSTYCKLQAKMWKYNDKGKSDLFISYLREKAEILDTCTDHLGRSLLHFAVEQDNYIFVHFLLSAGLNPNKIEHCGATPLTIAVCEKKQDFCKLLVKCNADVRGSMFMRIPSPLEMARKLELAEIFEILNPDLSDAEDCDIRSYDQGFVGHNQPLEPETSVAGDNYPNRAAPGFLTGTVGDAGSCKIIRSVMERS